MLLSVKVVWVVVETTVVVTKAITSASTFVQASVSGLAAWMASIVLEQ
jgi:hypothetical protein